MKNELEALIINKKVTNLDFMIGKRILIKRVIMNRCIKHSNLVLEEQDDFFGHTRFLPIIPYFPYQFLKTCNIVDFHRELVISKNCNIFFKGYKKGDEATIHFKIIAQQYR